MNEEIEGHLLWSKSILGDNCKFVQSFRGGNNLICKIMCGDSFYAIKVYPAFLGDPRDRVRTEFLALKFLRAEGLSQVPEVYAFDPCPPRLLLEWLEGESCHLSIDDEKLRFAGDFLNTVAKLGDRTESRMFSLASEACLSDVDILDQINRRLDGLRSIRQLEVFVQQFNEVFMRVYQHLDRSPNVSWHEKAVEKGCQTLIPADFSLHNVIKQVDGRHRVLDFEYFGWDDPVKVVADFVLHPAMNLTVEQQKVFLSVVLPSFSLRDIEFERRYQLRFPLFALRWALIVLRPFLEHSNDNHLKSERLKRALEYVNLAGEAIFQAN